MSNQARSSTLGRARAAARGVLVKGENMNFTRGGALTALGLLIVLGCGGSDASPLTGPGDEADSGTVVVDLPDGGKVAAPPAPEPPPVGGEPPEKAVFVSASKGAAGADGTKLRPVKSLAVAIALAKENGVVVVACADTYAEQVVLADGVTMFGFFGCDDLEKWERAPAGTKRALIASPISPAVVAEGLSLPMRFDGFEVQAPDAPATPAVGSPAASSYGMIVSGTKNLIVGEARISAGVGQDGSDGVEPAQGNLQSSGIHGAPATSQQPCNVDLNTFYCVTGGRHVPRQPGGRSTCAVGAAGGPGGDGGFAPMTRNSAYVQGIAEESARGMPTPSTQATMPNTAVGGLLGSIGNARGTDGPDGQPGESGTNGAWSFTPAGYVPGDGTAGATGLPGKGGGGGAGTRAIWEMQPFSPRGGQLPPAPYPTNRLPPNELGAAGAGGGAGGCGGIAGTVGAGGGASVGLLVVASELRVEGGTHIESKAGGRGGKGTLGTLGTPGGVGGAGAATLGRAYGAPGGNGGTGGPAGLSGSGAPGASIALAYSGKRPEMVGVSLQPGGAGAGAPALTRGAQSLPATAGVAVAEHAF